MSITIVRKVTVVGDSELGFRCIDRGPSEGRVRLVIDADLTTTPGWLRVRDPRGHLVLERFLREAPTVDSPLLVPVAQTGTYRLEFQPLSRPSVGRRRDPWELEEDRRWAAPKRPSPSLCMLVAA